MNLALADVGGEVLVVSQFTLYGDVRKGGGRRGPARRAPAIAAGARGGVRAGAGGAWAQPCGRGVFGAHMEVELLNDGPVTLVLDAGPLSPRRRGPQTGR